MKTAPGSPKEAKDVLGRDLEIADLWRTLERASVLFTAERRVGKTCVLEKMTAYPLAGRAVVRCTVESMRHPSEVVGAIYRQAGKHALLSRQQLWAGRFEKLYQSLAGAEIDGWRLPPVQSGWKALLRQLIEDIVANSDLQVIIVLDELPHALANMVSDGHPDLAEELLDTLRELRQQYQASGRFRFVLAGSIGLHLIIAELRMQHGYRGDPTNDLTMVTLGGMQAADVALMCQRYLDEEGIRRADADGFDLAMRQATDGLPLYIEYVCDRFQRAKRQSVCTEDITREVEDLLVSPEMEWFDYATERLSTHYSRLRADALAREILKLLCRHPDGRTEQEVLAYVRTQMVITSDDEVLRVLDLLRKDHYLDRTIADGRRSYRFLYEIMRRWWQLNKG